MGEPTPGRREARAKRDPRRVPRSEGPKLPSERDKAPMPGRVANKDGIAEARAEGEPAAGPRSAASRRDPACRPAAREAESERTPTPTASGRGRRAQSERVTYCGTLSTRPRVLPRLLGERSIVTDFVMKRNPALTTATGLPPCLVNFTQFMP